MGVMGVMRVIDGSNGCFRLLIIEIFIEYFRLLIIKIFTYPLS